MAAAAQPAKYLDCDDERAQRGQHNVENIPLRRQSKIEKG